MVRARLHVLDIVESSTGEYFEVHLFRVKTFPNTGAIPIELGNLSNLEKLSLWSNKLSREVALLAPM